MYCAFPCYIHSLYACIQIMSIYLLQNVSFAQVLKYLWLMGLCVKVLYLELIMEHYHKNLLGCNTLSSHRSKRKVLGRCESDEERSHGFITSPPITPTSSSPNMTWMPRQSSCIQRRLRRSNTSNDSFKALLLKKGSRSEPGFRMSAMEMLKCTDPRLQRSSAETSSPFSGVCTSPGRSRRASEEWARTEGVLPRLSASVTNSKYGRSSTPPCSASSRYNSRSRIPSGPMTVICEKEGELTETLDCCNIPFPVSLSSSGTMCTKGNT